MRQGTDRREPWDHVAAVIGWAAVAVMLLLATASCRTTRHTATHDTVFIDKVRTEYATRIDSVWRDCWHTEYREGDTVYRVDSLVLYRYLFRGDTVTLHDSVYVSRADTVTVEVRKPMSRFARGQIAGFWLLLVAALAAAAWRIYKKLR